MEWDAAAAVAREIAQGWTGEGGPGGAVVVFDTANIRAEACGGLANLDLDLPFHADTAVRYASISKHFFCSLLLADGSIELDDPIGAHLPLTPALGAVPVGRALDMTGGLPDAMETLWLLGVSPSTTLDWRALLRFTSLLEGLNFPPGSEISYSNTGYRLAQAALAAKGIEYGAALHERLCQPLGLGIRLPEDETDPVPALATGYWRGPRGWQRGRYGLHISASGGLAGSAHDLVAWLQALLAGSGPAAGLLARLGARRHLGDGRETDYGLGLARAPISEAIVIGHGESLPGYKNQFLLAPEQGAGVVVLSNREDSDANGLALRVMRALLGIASPAPAPVVLPEGRFVATEGPFWLSHAAGKAMFLGAEDTLAAGKDGAAENGSAHMPMRLRKDGDGIAGEIGHAARRFRPVELGLRASEGWAGQWSCPDQNARLGIEVSDGVAWLSAGAGPQHERHALTPLRDDLALLERGGGGPWTQRAAVWFQGDSLGLVTNRSRMLRFARV